MKEITPEYLRCALGSCPAVFEADKDHLVIIGSTKLTPEQKKEIQSRVGEDEFAIIIRREFFKELKT